MNTDTQLETMANGFADSIVKLVNDTDGPVTLDRIELEVHGFAKKEPPTWEYFIRGPDMELMIWAGMTEAGYRALNKVVLERKLAIQFVGLELYLIRGVFIRDAQWTPAVLIPAKGANLEAPRRLIRASEAACDYIMARAADEGLGGYRRLTPRSLRFTADQFSL